MPFSFTNCPSNYANYWYVKTLEIYQEFRIQEISLRIAVYCPHLDRLEIVKLLSFYTKKKRSRLSSQIKLWRVALEVAFLKSVHIYDIASANIKEIVRG